MGIKINFFKRFNKITRAKLLKNMTQFNGYSILRSSTNLNESSEFILELAKEYDEFGYISEELGNELDGLFKDDNYFIGIHRTGYNYMSDDMINSIFNTGLINNGHMMQGGNTGTQDIERTVTLLDDFTIFIGQLKSAHAYKCSEGCMVVKIPKSYLGRADGEVKPIYHKDIEGIKLLPEFIYGYIPTDNEGRLGNIKHNPNYKDDHVLDNENLLYESSALSKLKNSGIDLQQSKTNVAFKYEIIEKAYKDTLVRSGSVQAKNALLELVNKNKIDGFTGDENKKLLSKYILYGDIIGILILASSDLRVFDENVIIENFINSFNLEKEDNKKIV